MKRLLLVALSLLGLGLATVASQSNQTPNARSAAPSPVPHHFGGIQPRISPDGRQIAFSYQGAICRIAQTGGTITRLTDGSGFDLEPAWSPDGTQIAFVNEPRWAGGDLRIIRADDGSTVPLAKPVAVVDTVFYSKVEFHPDGRLLGNFRIDGSNIGLALLNPATGAVQPIVNPSRQARFALSRDGQWLAYTATMDVDGQQTGNDGPQADIWKISTAGGQPVRIVRFESRVHDLCWGADGRSLYVVSELGGAHDDIWHVPIDDPDRARRITSGQADETRPSVSADGRWLVCSDNRDGATALVVRDLANGTDMTLPISGLDFRAPAGTLRLTIRDKQSGRPVTARIALQHEGGKFHAPPGALHRVLDDYSHFYCDGAAQWSLPAGKYHLRAFRGPEYRPTHLDFTVSDGRTQEITVDLDRWTNAAERGWYSGENHIHANYGYGQWYNTPQSMLEQCAGEDLRVCNFMVANSDTNGVFDREFFRGHADPLSTADTTLYWNQEFRSTLWGHMTLVNLSQVVEPVFTGFKDTTNPWDIPTNSDIADRAHLQSGLVNYTHGAQNANDPYVGPYAGKGIPIDVALGKIDTIDLNASYAGTVPLWHRLLNCGFRVAPSAGTDCFLNRIRSRLPGADRVYVKIDGPFSYSAWIDGLRAGRSFVSSGPMLELSVDDSRSGDTLRLSAPREVRIVARATSQFPLNRVEVIFNGQAVANGSLSGDGLDVAIDTRLNIPRSGWISLRAAGATHRDHSGGPLEAHAAPIYIEVAGKPAASRADAEYFLQWIDRISLSLRLRDRIPSAELKRHVENQLEAARAVYTKIAQRGE
jgi:TolB protein